MNRLNYPISRIPVFLFLIIVVFDLVATHVDFDEDTYTKIYYVTNELIGSSFIANIFMLLVCFRNKLCYYNKVSVYGLLSLNVVNFLGMSNVINDHNYYVLISNIVMIPTALLVLILLIKRI